MRVNEDAIAATELRKGADVPATPPTLAADSRNIELIGAPSHTSGAAATRLTVKVDTNVFVKAALGMQPTLVA